MEAFNNALSAKQCWRLLREDNSLVARLLKAKYFSNSNVLKTALGTRPSYVWHSIWGARDVIIKGSRWLIEKCKSADV